MRVQFYTSTELEKQLKEDASKKAIPVNDLVNDILNRHYGLIPSSALTNEELRTRIFAEIKDYIDAHNPGDEFDLNEASETFRTIDVVYAGKPSSKRGQIGKAFNKMTGNKPFENVEQVKINGKPKLTTSNRAAIYVIKEKKEV